MADIHSAAAQHFGSSSSRSSYEHQTNQPLKYEVGTMKNIIYTWFEHNILILIHLQK